MDVVSIWKPLSSWLLCMYWFWSFLSSKKTPLEGEADAGKCRGSLYVCITASLAPGWLQPKPVSSDQSPVSSYLDAHITTSCLCDHIHLCVSVHPCQFHLVGLSSLAVSSECLCWLVWHTRSGHAASWSRIILLRLMPCTFWTLLLIPYRADTVISPS